MLSPNIAVVPSPEPYPLPVPSLASTQLAWPPGDSEVPGQLHPAPVNETLKAPAAIAVVPGGLVFEIIIVAFLTLAGVPVLLFAVLQTTA